MAGLAMMYVGKLVGGFGVLLWYIYRMYSGLGIWKEASIRMSPRFPPPPPPPPRVHKVHIKEERNSPVVE